ncbi:unnamed protein product [Prunus armeniaca]|nr:unnamed protein product [Prunus armeniaca]
MRERRGLCTSRERTLLELRAWETMKRFFRPVEKDGSAKKPTLSSSSENGEISGEGSKKEPLKFITWNANSFLLRVKKNWPEFTKFITSFDPDEVRMPAAGSKDALKNPGELKDDTSSSREEKQILMRALSSPPFGDYRVWWSLADSKYAGTALFVKKCFQPQKVFFNLDRKASKHEPDGRVILAEFETFNLLNTYAPNNGWKEEENSFPRRRKWDKRILEFVLQSSDKPLIWCGDLNVSHEEIDVSHPHFFSAAKLNGYVPPNKEDCGQPGFTLAERKRFGNILKEYVTPLENFVSMGKSRKRARMAKKAAPAKKPEKAVKFSTVMDTKNRLS